MSMSLRDQLLQAGLISAKQAKEAERQQQHQQRQQAPKRKERAPERQVAPAPAAHRAAGGSAPTPAAVQPPPPRANPALSAKVARDQALNRKQQEKAQKKALLDQIRQLIEQNRLPPIEGLDSYNFVDGDKIRRIAIDASARARLTRGEIAIVRHAGRYDLVPLVIANRIRERDGSAVMVSGAAQTPVPAPEGYEQFAVPDDLMW